MWRAVASLICAVSVMALPAPALAQTTNGQLAVVLKDRIVAVNDDGTGLRPLYTPASGDPITSPAWSPDGNKLAFVYQGKIAILDLASRAVLSTTPGDGRDLEPAWLADGSRLGFLRVRNGVYQRLTFTPGLVPLTQSTLDIVPDAFAFTPDLKNWAYRLGNLLLWSGSDLELVVGADDTPSWSAGGAKLAYVDTGIVWASGLRVRTFTDTPLNFKVADAPAAAPRWAPDASALAFVRGDQVWTVPAREGAPARRVPDVAGATAVDWQPCRADTTVGCRSILPPTCSATTAQITTQTDQAIELPPSPCTDPAGLEMQRVIVSGGDHGTVTGSSYTPRPGFVGQDTVTYRVTNGSAVSDLVRVTIFVVPRPAAAGPVPSTNAPPAVVAAPYLSARVKPTLDRRRTTLARVTCDQACSFTVRLQASLRGRKSLLKGTVVRRALAAERELALRLKLPAKPKGRLKTVLITGTVRGANGASRPVKLAVTVRR